MIFSRYSRSVDVILICLHFLIQFCRVHPTAAFSLKLVSRPCPLDSRKERDVVARSGYDRRSLALFGTKNRPSKSSPSSKASDAPPQIEFTDFWGTSIRNEVPAPGVPCVPSLDLMDGPLPPGAYQIIAGNDDNDAHSQLDDYDRKATCRISVAPDLHLKDRGRELDPKEMVRNLQRLVDGGFQTMQLASPDRGMQTWGEEEIFGRLARETPAHVMDYCNIVVPLAIPGANSVVSTNSIRQSVFDKLARTGGDAIDTLLLEHCEDSPYHLDVLDILTELQRQGYIRSIATKNVPSKILKSARRCGFAIDASQVEGNVLKPPLKSKEDKNVWLTSPLCGGFLSDKHMGKVVLPSMWEWSLSEQHQWRTTLYEWGDAQLSSQKGNNRKHRVVDHAWLWRRYQQDVLDPLVYISQKHCVSTASVALRWALQSDADDRVGSVVVASKMILDPRTGRPFDRHVRLREAFRFELDEEDMEQLKRIPNEKEPEPQLLLDEASFEEKYLEQGQWENMEEDYQKFLETQDRDYESRATIDFGNKSLWL